MRNVCALCIAFLCALALSSCAGGNTGVALGYGRHGPGVAVFMDPLWYTPHQAGVSVPMGWESGEHAHAPAAAPASPRPAPSTGPLTGYVEPSRPSAEKAPPGPRARNSEGAPPSSGRLGEVPSVLTPPDLSY